jgi:hypothetical protein
MSEPLHSMAARPLTADEKALLRRCCPVRRITDDEIVFRLENPALGKALWLTFVWALWMLAPVAAGWTGDGQSVAWIYLGIFPTFLLTWLAASGRAQLLLARGGRTMTTVLRDGRWTIHLPRGSSPTDWRFPTASIPFRLNSDEMDRVEAWEVLQRFSGADLSEKTEDSPLEGLLACGADVLGYDDTSISIANFSSARSWVVGVGASLLLGAPAIAFFVIAFSPTYGRTTALLAGALSMLGAGWVAYDGRSSSVATFLKGKRQVFLFRRGIGRTVNLNEGLIRVISDSDGGEFVGVPDVFSCAPTAGTATALVRFLQSYLVPEKRPTTQGS